MFSKMFRAALISLTFAVTAQAQVQDTINKKTPLFVGKDALLLGAFLLGTAAVAPLDMKIASRLQYQGTQENKFLGRAATGFRLLGDPGSFVVGTVVYLVGRADLNRRAESVGLHSLESMLLADVLGGGTKVLVGRQRPFYDIRAPYNFQLWRGLSSDQYRSFPSGHTITAFAFASTVTRESQFWWPHSAFYVGTVFYGGATLVGLSRIYNNQHWASDVMAGAALGTIVGLKVVTYTHSHPGNHIDRELIKGKGSSQIQINPVLFSIQF
ncbi:MAG TPA: phosphatase PAP2 family protein [Gemmatimonadaceae bacterium]|nr:phosphatase PAP2 family protein [Gemmatimonadaceae bacterium]